MDLNYEETVVYNNDAIRPAFLIVYGEDTLEFRLKSLFQIYKQKFFSWPVYFMNHDLYLIIESHSRFHHILVYHFLSLLSLAVHDGVYWLRVTFRARSFTLPISLFIQ